MQRSDELPVKLLQAPAHSRSLPCQRAPASGQHGRAASAPWRSPRISRATQDPLFRPVLVKSIPMLRTVDFRRRAPELWRSGRPAWEHNTRSDQVWFIWQLIPLLWWPRLFSNTGAEAIKGDDETFKQRLFKSVSNQRKVSKFLWFPVKNKGKKRRPKKGRRFFPKRKQKFSWRTFTPSFPHTHLPFVCSWSVFPGHGPTTGTRGPLYPFYVSLTNFVRRVSKWEGPHNLSWQGVC